VPGEALPPVVSARVERLARQLKPLHDAVAELSAAAAVPSSVRPVVSHAAVR